MDLGFGGGKKKSKFMIGIIAGAVGSLLMVAIIPAAVTSGITAVADFVSGVCERIGDFFTPDDLLEELGDETSITEKDLEGWMITRNTMLHLLVEAEAFNNREPRTKTFNIEGRKWWDEYVPLPTATPAPTAEPESDSSDEGATATPAPTTTSAPTASPAPTPVPVIQYEIVHHDEKETTAVVITEDRDIINRYKVSWQLAYMLLIYKYMDMYENQNLIYDIPTSEIDMLLDELEPYIMYEFDPIAYWPLKTTLSDSDVAAHPHKYLFYQETVTDSSIVNGIINHERRVPQMRIDEVLLPYGKDVYEYKYVQVGNGVFEEQLTYRREYDKEKFMRIIEPYLGERGVDAFMAAFELMPDVEELYAELEIVLSME